MKLIYTATKKEVQVGDKVTLSDGEIVTVTSITKPHKPSSTGRVNVVTADGFGGSYFPSVIDAEWIEREDQA